MTIDSSDTVIAEADRADERAPDDQIENAAEDRQGKRRQRDAVRVEAALVSVKVENAETVQEFTGGIAAKRDKSPEDKRVGETGRRALENRLSLQQDVDDEALRAELREFVQRERCWGLMR